jgi:hypothetical protein
MQELIDYLSAFEPTLAKRVKGVPAAQLREFAALCEVALPDDYVDFLRTMGQDYRPLVFFDGDADFRFTRVWDFYSTPDWRPKNGGIFIANDYSGGGADYFLQSPSPSDPMQVVRYPSGEDDFPPMLIHPDFANMLFTLGFLSLRLGRLPHKGQLLAAGSQPWDQSRGGSRLEVLSTLALNSGLVAVPHTGSWSVAYNGPGSALVYYEVPDYSPSVSVAADSADSLTALAANLTGALSLISVR